MKIISGLLAAFGIVGGLYYMFQAFVSTAVPLGGASAIQISQVYNTGTFYAAMAVACFVFAVVCLLAYQAPPLGPNDR